MLFMLVVKASPTSETGTLPSLELMEAMSKYNKELIKAGSNKTVYLPTEVNGFFLSQ